MISWRLGDILLQKERNEEKKRKEKDSLSLSLSLSLSHVSNICKTVSKNIFSMSQLKRYVSSQTLKIFCSSHILPHISFSSTVWNGCGEIHLNKLNSLHRRAAKLLLSEKKIHQQTKKWKPLAYYRYINNCTLIRQYSCLRRIEGWHLPT